jgi:hypothetical protein
MSSSLADDEYNFFAYPSLSCFLAIIERRRVNAVSGDFYRSGWGSSRRIAQLLLGYGAHVAPGIVYSTLDSRPGTALSAIGRFYARRSFGLPMEYRSQHCTRSVSFMISTTEPPQPLSKRREHQSIAAATPKSSPNPGFGRSLPNPYPPKRALMKRQRHLQKISAGISLVILSLGFSFLGLLSFFNKPHADLANVPCVDSAYRIAGSAASLLAGTTFVVASCVYWRRYPGWPA